MEVALNQEQQEVQAREVRTMTQTKAWKTLLARLDRLSQHRETEVANHLRKAEFNKAIYMQGLVDGVKLITDEVAKLSYVKTEDNPIDY